LQLVSATASKVFSMTLAASTAKKGGKASVWYPSVRLSVCLSVPSSPNGAYMAPYIQTDSPEGSSNAANVYVVAWDRRADTE